VGEPWNALAVKEGLGHVLITSYELWNNGPEKVLGVSQEWAAQHPRTHRALIQALLEAAQWLDMAENRIEVAETIARSMYVNAPPEVVRMSMTGTFQFAPRAFPRRLPDFNVFYRYAANFPWRSHAVWLMTQMLRWGQIDKAIALQPVAEAVYRTDIYREAAQSLGLDVPQVDYKTEGTHDGLWPLRQSDAQLELGADQFFDQQRFSPADPIQYLEAQKIKNHSVSMAELQKANPRWPNAMQQQALADSVLSGVEQADKRGQ
jgi:nitrate/nitrite transport system substrate-binding protein